MVAVPLEQAVVKIRRRDLATMSGRDLDRWVAALVYGAPVRMVNEEPFMYRHEHFEPLPRFSSSLDAVHLAELHAINRVGYPPYWQALSDVVGGCLPDCRMVCADPLQRARAVAIACLGVVGARR